MDKSLRTSTNTNTGLSRRSFLKASALSSGGLLLSVALPGCTAIGMKNQGMVSAGEWQSNAWLRIDTDNRITFILDRVEMGQGTYTGLVTLLAEELWKSTRRWYRSSLPASAAPTITRCTNCRSPVVPPVWPAALNASVWPVPARVKC